MISTLPPEKLGFENLTNNQIVDIYHQFYSAEYEKKYGVLAIKIQILNKKTDSLESAFYLVLKKFFLLLNHFINAINIVVDKFAVWLSFYTVFNIENTL